MSKLKIERVVVGQLATNCYLVNDPVSREGIIIDPGDAAAYLLDKINASGMKPRLIVATHGHFDHLLAAAELQLALKIPFLLHPNDLFLVKRMADSARHWLGTNVQTVPPLVDHFLKEGELIKFGREKLKVLGSPGHSPGGVCFYGRGALFSGDTLFYRGVGRTDLAYSSEEDLARSIKNLRRLPGKTVVYPGHGKTTTLQSEKLSIRG